jgi:hypothetical protein
MLSHRLQYLQTKNLLLSLINRVIDRVTPAVSELETVVLNQYMVLNLNLIVKHF